MPSLEDFSRIVGAIYSAALAPDGWAAPLADLRHTLDAVAAGLLVAENRDRTIKSASLPEEARADYAAHYRTMDYVLAEVEVGPVGLVRDGAELVALQPDSEFNVEWMNPYGVDDGLFVRLTATEAPTCFLVAAPQRSESFATAERVAFVNALVPHWQQALRAQDQLRGLDHACEVLDAMDSMRHGLIVLDSAGSIVHLNRAAVRILAAGEGLRSRGGTIEAVRPSTDSELQISIGRAVHCGVMGYRGAAAITCARPSGKLPYVVHILPLEQHQTSEPGCRALVVVVDPDDRPCPDTELVRRIFGMTKAESEIALRILNGDGLKPVAEELNLSLATVKTHLQHVFDKTGTHRQAELVRLLLGIVP